eukprot:361618-Chlamydomonas_euryale.AAC.4
MRGCVAGSPRRRCDPPGMHAPAERDACEPAPASARCRRRRRTPRAPPARTPRPAAAWPLPRRRAARRHAKHGTHAAR